MTDPNAPDTPTVTPQIVTGTIMRYRYIWTGGAVGTGYTTLWGAGAGSQAFADATWALMNAACIGGASSAVAGGITITPDGFVDLIDVPTGALTDSQGITAPAPIVNSASVAYAAPAGACITWTTAGVVERHRVRGRTFIVPLVSSKYDTQGTLLDSYRTALLAAANTYRVGTWAPVVYHRAVLGAGGSAYPITGSGVRDRVSYLSSRR